MNEKDKANELINWAITNGASKEVSKLFANKIIDEVLNLDNIKPYVLHKEIIKYYIEVKQEIEKI
jgi:hypothetical protein